MNLHDALAIVGALPTADWAGDVTVHFSGMVKYSK
jgi:hypothetical protein